jgi:ferredoxin
MPYIVAEPCVGVKSGECVDVCPVACIHTTPDSPQNYIDPDICIECEQCVIVCPVEAIFLDTDLPEKWHDFIDVNAAFFRQKKAAPEPIHLAAALRAVEAVHAYARENAAAVTAVVVDDAGRPIVVGRMDGADPNSVELALSKAYTSASFRLPSGALAEQAKRPWFRSLVLHSHGRILPAGGAFPIIDREGEIATIGAIGVAGGQNAEQDVLCCRVGMAALESAAHH